jgi:hypothetical protein
MTTRTDKQRTQKNNLKERCLAGCCGKQWILWSRLWSFGKDSYFSPVDHSRTWQNQRMVQRRRSPGYRRLPSCSTSTELTSAFIMKYYGRLPRRFFGHARDGALSASQLIDIFATICAPVLSNPYLSFFPPPCSPTLFRITSVPQSCANRRRRTFAP